uniref:Taste receptor, type 1, member 2, tandem duplicate 1 n=1 Tax=Paramormyrops kingsleyae TaxID=1676925 RepID=A0A3B3SPZ3_9TELE
MRIQKVSLSFLAGACATMSMTAWFRLGISLLCWSCSVAGGGCPLPDFNLAGNYLLGGLFAVHEVNTAIDMRNRLPAFDFVPSGYQQMQVFRFAVEEINNSSVLLPGIKLGYEIFDYCSDALNFRAALDFLSSNGSISLNTNLHKVISVTGPSGSTKTLILAPLFMSNLIPMVNPSASSVQLSNKNLYPSFFRTVPSDFYQVRAIVRILQQFQWNWVAFFGSEDDYSQDALTVFQNQIPLANICLAYKGILSTDTSTYSKMFETINSLNISVVVVFATIEFVRPFIQVAINNNVQKIWIASETWSLNQDLITDNGAKTLGVILGVSIPEYGPLSGFNNFIYRTMDRLPNATCSNVKSCNQACQECLTTDPKVILDQDPSYNFPIYSAVYAIANALHVVLQCGTTSCNVSTPVYPHTVTKMLRQVSFTLFNKTMKFDKHGNPPARYNLVSWDWSSRQLIICVHPMKLQYIIVTSRGQLQAPVLRCSQDCKPGYSRVKSSFNNCCFDCKICGNGTYINYTVDPYTCVACEKDEWSEDGSVLCQKRSPEYLQGDDFVSAGITLSASLMVLSSAAIVGLFAYHQNTPIVRSAGGKMCFFLLTCLGLSSISVFFFIGRPGPHHCILRNSVFAVCYTACLSCLAVRSFQIFCVFKMATNLPKSYEYWVKDNGQWVIIATCVVVQLFLCVMWVTISGPSPIDITVQKVIIFDCTLGNAAIFYLIIMFMGFLSVICFTFAYLGTDLPKNYNEGKCITFSLIVFYISWAIFLTVHLAARESNTAAVNAISILCSLYGVLYGYFFPKCYIILFKPDHNTAAYFQTSIQSYTLQSSST